MSTREAVDGAAALTGERPSLRSLRRAAAGCEACPLWRGATQTVFDLARDLAAVARALDRL